MASTMPPIQIGGCYIHAVHGPCVVAYRNSRGYWIQVWGGPTGEKIYTHKGIQAGDLARRAEECRECLAKTQDIIDGLCLDCQS